MTPPPENPVPTPEFDISLIREGEETACNAFHNRLYGKSRSLSQWKWEFERQWKSSAPIPFVCARHEGKIVGTQAFIPIQLIDQSGVFWSAKSEETLVDPEYRGMKLFEKMYDCLFDYARAHNLAAIWGFTPAIKAFTRLGFISPGKTEQIFMPFDSRAFAPLLRKSGHSNKKTTSEHVRHSIMPLVANISPLWSSLKCSLADRKVPTGLTVKPLDQADEQMSAVGREFVRLYDGVTICRDAAYMNWRLFQNPYVRSVVRAVYREERLLGWVAYTLGDDNLGYLVDLMVADENGTRSTEAIVRFLLLDAVYGTLNMGATGIRGWHVNGHSFDGIVLQQATRLGFFHVKQGHEVVIHDLGNTSRHPSLARFDDWYVTRIFTEGVLS